MDTPEGVKPLKLIADYWKEIVATLTVLGGIWTYAKLLHGKWKNLKIWLKNAADAPGAILELRQEIQLDGISLRQTVINIGGDVQKLASLLNAETTWRRPILDSLHVPIFEADKDGRFMWANSELLEATNCEMPQVMGNKFRNFIADPDRRTMMEGWSDAVRDGTDFRGNFRLSGTTQWMMFDAVCNKDTFGNVLGFVGKLRKIDDPQQHSTQG